MTNLSVSESHQSALIQARIDIERLTVEVKHLHQDNLLLRQQMTAISEQLTAITRTLSEASGGWKVLLTVGAAASACGALLMNILSHISFIK